MAGRKERARELLEKIRKQEFAVTKRFLVFWEVSVIQNTRFLWKKKDNPVWQSSEVLMFF